MKRIIRSFAALIALLGATLLATPGTAQAGPCSDLEYQYKVQMHIRKDSLVQAAEAKAFGDFALQAQAQRRAKAAADIARRLRTRVIDCENAVSPGLPV
ncbi:MAG: hypothetical protein ACRC0L_07325 [Angustibacter sp.]